MTLNRLIKLTLSILFVVLFSSKSFAAGNNIENLKVDWSFAGITGKFDRSSLQRGYQVYKEVCASCHSMQYLSFRNLGEKGGPEFSEEEVKAIAAEVMNNGLTIKRLRNIKKFCNQLAAAVAR